MALPRRERLTSRTRIEEIRRRMRPEATPIGRIYIAPGGTGRAVIIVSTKVSKNAVKRNEIRRILQEWVRPFLNRAGRTFDMMIVASPELGLASRRELWARARAAEDVTRARSRT